MTAYRFPVLTWEDYEGCFTASLVEYENAPAGLGVTAAEAVAQLKEYLAWLFKEDSRQPAPDFFDARLIQFKVEVRPGYRDGGQVYACDRAVALRVACVHGRNAHGLHVCAVPTIGLRFHYHEPGELKELVTHYVQSKLNELTPRQLSRFLPPQAVALDEILLHVTHKDRPRYVPSLDALQAVAEPLGERSLRRQFSRAWEREREVADLAKRIGRERANVILVGEPGSGKTTALVAAVRQVERDLEQQPGGEEQDVPAMYRRKFWLTSGARLIAGMPYLGQWEARCEQVIDELATINGVLCIDNLLDLVRTGSGRDVSSSLASFLLPYLQRGELRLVAEATRAELDACRRLLPGLADLFQILPLPPFNREQAVAVLNRVAGLLASNLQVRIGEGVAETVYHLFHRFLPYHAFPGRTVSFMNTLAEHAPANEVSTAGAIEHFIRQTGLPELFLRDELLLDHAEVVETFSRQVIGQETACNTAAQLVTTFKAGLNDPNRPIGVLLFCGPTGVGKTELARVVAQFFFGHGADAGRLLRLDMSEYSGWGAAERLLVAPSGEPSDLINRLRRQPFTVLLLDEIEKAEAEVFDVLLSVFDEGRLTDRYGRTTNCHSAVIIMTSNLGADKLGAAGFGQSPPPSYTADAMAFFRPEFFNRIDAVVQFNPLNQEMMLAIAGKELRELAAREGLTKVNLRLRWSEEVLQYLAREGFDARYGARPLQRTIEQLVVAPLARYLIERPGLQKQIVRISLEEGQRVRFGNEI